MVELRDDEVTLVFRALGDPTRRRMLDSLKRGERTVSELAEPFAMSLAAASKHVKVLERAGLVRRTVVGRTHRCRLEADRLARAHAWLRHYERFWSERLDALEAVLAEEESTSVGASTSEAAADCELRTGASPPEPDRSPPTLPREGAGGGPPPRGKRMHNRSEEDGER